MESSTNFQRSNREREEVIMLKESFHQLEKLQEECSQDMADYQRETFSAHEEFRAIASTLFDSIDAFYKQINEELDKLNIRINRIETIALHSYKISHKKVLNDPTTSFIDIHDDYLYLVSAKGTISVYNLTNYCIIESIQKEKYDPLGTHGRVTHILASKSLYVGYQSGVVFSFNPMNLSMPVALSYPTSQVTSLHLFDNILYVGSGSGVVTLWSIETSQRVFICPVHRLSITAIFDDGTDVYLADRTGSITRHDKLCSKTKETIQLNTPLLYFYPLSKDKYLSVSPELKVWSGNKCIKTFNALDVSSSPICCVKRPELLLLGSKDSTQLTFLFLESLLFPKTISILDSPCKMMINHGPDFLVLSSSGSVYHLKPGQ